MQFCEKHWAELKNELIRVNLESFVFKDGERALKVLYEHLSGRADITEPYDPLMKAYLDIVANAVEAGGPYILGGDYCPLCELEANTPAKAAEWIEPCFADILKDFKEKGWYKQPLVM